MIYIFWAKGTDLIKVGYTKGSTHNLRLSELQIGCPYPLEVVAFADGTLKDEEQFHALLRQAKAHVRGEWFRWCPTAHKIAQILKAQPLNLLRPKSRHQHRRLGAALSLELQQT